MTTGKGIRAVLGGGGAEAIGNRGAAGWELRAMWGLTALFGLRVAGQAVVAATGGVSFLPPMREWQSGLLPYPVLLGCQLGILTGLVWLTAAAQRERGPFTVPHVRASTRIRRIACVYACSMVVRYVLTMALLPERRWFGGTIPIWFHLVLAGWLLLLSRRLADRGTGGPDATAVDGTASPHGGMAFPVPARWLRGARQGFGWG